MATIVSKIPASLNTRLECRARELRVSKSAFVREAIEAHLKKNKAGKQPTVYDLVSDLLGKGSGPRDLSTNKKYLEDLGA